MDARDRTNLVHRCLNGCGTEDQCPKYALATSLFCQEHYDARYRTDPAIEDARLADGLLWGRLLASSLAILFALALFGIVLVVYANVTGGPSTGAN